MAAGRRSFFRSMPYSTGSRCEATDMTPSRPNDRYGEFKETCRTLSFVRAGFAGHCAGRHLLAGVRSGRKGKGRNERTGVRVTPTVQPPVPGGRLPKRP